MRHFIKRASPLLDLTLSLFFLTAATLLGALFYRLDFSDSTIMMSYLLGVLMIAVGTSHRVYSLLCSVVSVLLFNYFFVDPRFSLQVLEPGYPVVFLALFVTSFITSTLAVRLKDAARQAEENAREREAAAVQIENERLRSTLLRAISHDLRTPLNSIAGFVMLLMKNADNSAKVMEYAHRIGMSCQDLLVVINQIIDVSGTESGSVEADHREFALGQTIEEIADVIRSKAQLKHQRFEVTTHGIEHDIFLGDRVRITESLMNLLNNAIQYTPEGGEISLSVYGRDDEPGYRDISFEVRDNGIGMSSELQKRLFENVGRFDKIPGMHGSGIGIAMTRKFVAQMGGTISVQSAPDQGSTFFIGLRLQTAGGAEDHFWSDRGINRVLVVGENMNEAARICKLLRNTGLDAEYTASAYGALQLVEQSIVEEHTFNLLLFDRDIQDKGYWELADEILAMPWSKAPSIILMSDKAEHFTQNVHKAGIAAIMPKPFFFSTFRSIVEEMSITKDRMDAGVEEVATNPLGGLRFLVAEDNKINADVLKELLEVEGARCEIAGNGKAAVAMFRNSRPGYYDMILMDIRMPLMDGYAATAEIRGLEREDAAGIPILAMTADTMEEDVERSFACGMNAHIPKPLNIKELNREVYRLRSGR